MKPPKVPVAQEGYPFIFCISFLTLIFAILGCQWIAYIGLILTLFVLSFFRDPERFVPRDTSSIVSPADGRILSIETIEDTVYLKQRAQKISIFMNVFNVHVNRNPYGGTVEDILYTPGKFYSADSDKAGLLNEKCATVLKLDTGNQIAFVQIAGLIARRIVTWIEPGDRVVKGDRMGLIRFGSRVDVYLPADTVIAIKRGQKVKAGETVLAHFVAHSEETEA